MATASSPLFTIDDSNDTDNNADGNDHVEKSPQGVGLIDSSRHSLTDRAAAILSAYREYLDDNSASCNHEKIFDHVECRDLVALNDAVEEAHLDVYRKEQIKLATLDKFCSDDSSERDRQDQKKLNKKKKKKTKKDKSRNEHDCGHNETALAGASLDMSASSSLSHDSHGDTHNYQNIPSHNEGRGMGFANSSKSHFFKSTLIAGEAAVAFAAQAIGNKYRKVFAKTEQEEVMDNSNHYDVNSYKHDNYCGDGGLAAPSSTTCDDDFDLRQHHDSRDNEDLHYNSSDIHSDISPLGDKGLIFREDDIDEDGNYNFPSFHDICVDLGVTPETHSNIHRHYKWPIRRPLSSSSSATNSFYYYYRYPIFSSKKCRNAICYGAALLLVAIIFISIASAVTNGFEEVRRKNAPPLPDWEKDEKWRQDQKLKWEMEHGGKYEGGVTAAASATLPNVTNIDGVEDLVIPPPPSFMSETDKMFESVSAAYRPVWFDRSTGWKGVTYQQAMDFCDSYNHFIPCPYEVYCPFGDTLISGVMDHDGESWAAVINARNEWVQVGTEGECDLYSKLYKKGPEWGLERKPSTEVITRHIMCCRSHPYPEGSEWNVPNQVGSGGNDYVHKPLAPSSDDNAIASVSETEISLSSSNTASSTESLGKSSMTEWEVQILNAHHPAWFSFELGWQGTTLLDAKEFCQSIDHGEETLHLCPLEAYCPNGPRETEPLYLQRDAYEGEQWAPVESTSENEWVMVGMLNKDKSSTCRTYMQLHHKQPAWGVDGSSTDKKKYILCCQRTSAQTDDLDKKEDNGVDTPEGDMLSDVIIGIQSGSDNSENSSSNIDITESGSFISRTSSDDPVSHSILETFDPLWYDASSGWNGGSHDDAIQFCNRFDGLREKKMELCPYAAYCPSGPSKPFIGGLSADFNEEGEQWAPAFGQQNHWILISQRGQNSATSCLSHVQLYNEMPSWGLDTSRQEVKKHIMCCSPLQ